MSVPCREIDCVNPPDFPDIGSLVPPAALNEAVFFPVTCDVGELLSYAGVLPSWITLDTANSQLVGSAGVWSAVTVAAATALAQAALDSFAQAAIDTGALSCHPWSPDNLLIGPRDWYDASQMSLPEGDPVTLLTDFGYNLWDGHDVAPAPRFRLGVQNDLPGINYDETPTPGSSFELRTPGNLAVNSFTVSLNQPAGLSFFSVVRSPVGISQCMAVSRTFTAPVGHAFNITLLNTGKWTYKLRGDIFDAPYSSVVTYDGATRMVELIGRYLANPAGPPSSFVAGDISFYQDGNLDSTNNLKQGPSEQDAFIGGIASSTLWLGFLFEIMAFDYAIGTDLRQVIEGYLAWKWGTFGNLPASHPFKNVRPTIGTVLPPMALSASLVDATSFAVNWTGSGPVEAYVLDVATDAAFTAPVISNLNVGPQTSYPVTGLTPSTQYWYRVRQYYLGTFSDYSNVISATTTAIAITTTDLLLWVKANTIVALDNQSFNTWPDSSGLGNDPTQTTSQQEPSLSLNQLNGYPAVRFLGTDHYMNVPSILVGVTEGEVFVVVKKDNDPAVGVQDTGLCSWGGIDDPTGYPSIDSVVRDNFLTTARKTVGNPAPSLADWRLYNTSSKAAEWIARLDGAIIFTTAVNTVSVAGDRFIGRSKVGGTDFFCKGYIAEIILYKRVLTTGERDAVEAYIAAKYGLTIP